MISIDWQDEQHPEKLCCGLKNGKTFFGTFRKRPLKGRPQPLCHKFLLYRAVNRISWSGFVAKKFGLVKYRRSEIISNEWGKTGLR